MSTPWMLAVGALWGFTLFLALIVFGLLRRIAPVLEQAEKHLASAGIPDPGGLATGTRVPPFYAVDEAGNDVSGDSMVGKPWVALFLSAGCRPCEEIVAALRTTSLETDAELVLIVDVHARDLVEGVPVRTLYQENGALSNAFEIVGTPYAFAIDETGAVVDSAIATSLASVEELTQKAEGGERLRPTATLVS